MQRHDWIDAATQIPASKYITSTQVSLRHTKQEMWSDGYREHAKSRIFAKRGGIGTSLMRRPSAVQQTSGSRPSFRCCLRRGAERFDLGSRAPSATRRRRALARAVPGGGEGKGKADGRGIPAKTGRYRREKEAVPVINSKPLAHAATVLNSRYGVHPARSQRWHAAIDEPSAAMNSSKWSSGTVCICGVG